MTVLDRVFGCLMVPGGIGHGLGLYKAYANESMKLLIGLDPGTGFLSACSRPS
jgi:hypothetical protein